jgi:hypothetical protein
MKVMKNIYDFAVHKASYGLLSQIVFMLATPAAKLLQMHQFKGLRGNTSCWQHRS